MNSGAAVTLKTNFRASCIAVASLAIIGISGCSTTPKEDEDAALKDLSTSLKQAADRAAQVRVEMAQMKPVALDNTTAQRPATARIDINYVGPVENALRIVTNSLGWQFIKRGKERGPVVVHLRHDNVDSITVLRDIGAQCQDKCDVHVDLVEGGKSKVTLTYRK